MRSRRLSLACAATRTASVTVSRPPADRLSVPDPGRPGGVDPRKRAQAEQRDRQERGNVIRDRVRQRQARTDAVELQDRKSTRLNSSHSQISYAVFCLKKKKMEPVRLRVHERHHSW